MESSLRVESPEHDTTNDVYDRLLDQVVELLQCRSSEGCIAMFPGNGAKMLSLRTFPVVEEVIPR